MGLWHGVVFPWATDVAMRRETVQRHRRPVLEHARGRVLEVGFGTGASLAAYPRDGRVGSLTGLEPSPGMIRRASDGVCAARRFPVEIVEADARAMPFDDGTFDTVVSSYTLCSVRPAASMLSEVRRVLRPDGLFVFVEHGLAESPATRRLQRWLDPVQRVLADGCSLTVDVAPTVERSGFEIRRVERFRALPGPGIWTSIVRGLAAPSSVGRQDGASSASGSGRSTPST